MTGVQTCALPICFPVTILRQDDVSPYALINEKQNGYKCGLTKEENVKLMGRSMDKEMVEIYKSNIDCIENEQFIVVDDK